MVAMLFIEALEVIREAAADDQIYALEQKSGREFPTKDIERFKTIGNLCQWATGGPVTAW